MAGEHWDAAIKSLREAIIVALRLEVELENLHTALPNFSPSAEHHKSTMAAKEKLLQPLADPAIHADLLSAYGASASLDPATPGLRLALLPCCHLLLTQSAAGTAPSSADALVCNVVAPSLAATLMPEQELSSLYYACMPTLRVQTPSDDLATIRPHCDAMYGLPAGSLNYWIPLTPVAATSALWVEAGKGEDGEEQEPELERLQDEQSNATGSFSMTATSQPFGYRALLRPTRFDGHGLIHFTVPNRSPYTRVSLDFRCVPGHVYDESARLAKLGYYSRAEQVVSTQIGSITDAAAVSGRGSWVKAENGRVSKLHGLPHRG